MDGVKVVALMSGRKLTGYALLLAGATIVLNVVTIRGHVGALGPLAEVVGLLALVLAITGLYRIGEAFDYPMWLRVTLVVSMMLPVAGLVVLVVMYWRSTQRLAALADK